MDAATRNTLTKLLAWFDSNYQLGVSAEDAFRSVQKLSDIGKETRVYFLDAPGGTGKTFTISALESLLELREHKIIAVAISAVAASILSGGRRAHSVFKIPIPCLVNSVCDLKTQFA